MSRESIIDKAYRCIDEIYPDANTLNEGYLPIEAFMGEVVHWVIKSVPLHTLTIRESGSDVLGDVTVDNNNVGRGIIPEDIGRIAYFRAAGWKRPVLEPIYDTDALYRQQMNKVLRGNPTRPVAAIVGANMLEWYTATQDASYVIDFVPFDVDYIPSMLEDIAAWKLAEVVLLSMNDAQAASICTAKVNEHLNILA